MPFLGTFVRHRLRGLVLGGQWCSESLGEVTNRQQMSRQVGNGLGEKHWCLRGARLLCPVTSPSRVSGGTPGGRCIQSYPELRVLPVRRGERFLSRMRSATRPVQPV